MSYIDNMNYVGRLCELYELCKLYEYFTNGLKSLEITWFDLDVISLFFKIFILFLLIKDGKIKL